jgi:dienelactone hydrolase
LGHQWSADDTYSTSVVLHVNLYSKKEKKKKKNILTFLLTHTTKKKKKKKKKKNPFLSQNSHAGQQMASFVVSDAAWAEGDQRPVVFILPDWDGLNQYELERAHLIVRDLGYVAVGVDVYGAQFAEVPEVSKRIELVTRLLQQPSLFLGRVRAAIDVARDQVSFLDASRIAIYGYCLGGTGALSYVTAGFGAKAVAAYHPNVGGRASAPTNPTIVSPLLVLTGGKDGGADVASVLELEAKLRNTTSYFELVRYGHVRHAFSVWGAADYDAHADERSWNSARGFVKAALEGADAYEKLAASQRPAAAVGNQVAWRTVSVVDQGEKINAEVYWSPAWLESDSPRPAVVIVHDADGINEYERTRARMFVERGYFAVTADVFGAEAHSRIANLTSAERGALLGKWRAAPDAFVRRVLANVNVLQNVKGVDTTRIAATGYCFGGTAVLNLALTEKLSAEVAAAGVRAVVSYHGGLGGRAVGASNITVRVAAYMGSLDERPADVAALEAELTARNAPAFEITRYSNTNHAFTVFGGARYSARADARSFEAGVEYIGAALRDSERLDGSHQPLFVNGGSKLNLHSIYGDSKAVLALAERLATVAKTTGDAAPLRAWKDQLPLGCTIGLPREACAKEIARIFRHAAREINHPESAEHNSDDSGSDSSSSH